MSEENDFRSADDPWVSSPLSDGVFGSVGEERETTRPSVPGRRSGSGVDRDRGSGASNAAFGVPAIASSAEPSTWLSI